MNRSKISKAVVLSCLGGSQGTLGVVRTLGREGVPVTLVSENRESPVLHSKYCKEKIHTDGLNFNHKETLDILIDYAKRQNEKPLLFPTADPDLAFISRERHELAKYFHLFISSEEIIENFMDKGKFYKYANKMDSIIPRTFIPENIDEVSNVGDKMEYPAIIKPLLPVSWTDVNIQKIVDCKKALIVASKDELIGMYKKIAAYDKGMVIQEYIHGRDDDLYSLHIYMDRNSEPLGYFTGRKIRTYPAYAGIGCFVISVYVEEIIEKGIRMLRQVNYNGLALLQFKKDARSGEFKLLEINPRTSSWNLLAYECGINLPYIAYADTVKIDFQRPGKQVEGVKYLYLKNDVNAFREYWKKGDWTLLGWLNSLRGKKVYQVYAWDDPKPFFIDITRNLKKKLTGKKVYKKAISLIPFPRKK